MATVRSVCPLNCPDCCSFLVEVLDNKIQVHGDIQTMGVRGFICSKGRALADMVYSPDRLKYPLLKTKGQFHKISWDEAYAVVVEKIRQTIAAFGSTAILHLYDFGHNGILRQLDRRFFQALGGVTEPRGSMCWGAGIAAQEKDFGAVYSGDWEQLLASQTIILWGRDPAVTNKHLIPLLREAGEKGAHIIVINPIKVKSTAFANAYVKVNPGTDGILALGIAHIILRERWMDFDFVKDYAVNFGSYAALIKLYPPERVAQITGVAEEVMEDLARRITHRRPVMFYLGYGLQRYLNGWNTVRAIDALGVISGNIGIKGAGVFYAHQYHKLYLNNMLLPEDQYHNRTFPHAVMAGELLREDLNPKIQLAFVTRTNPLVTQPDSVKWRELWNTIPFKVTLDMRMSQTAAMSDLVLPITTIFEEEDLVATSWSTRIHYAQKAIEPLGDAKPEPLIFTELAQKLGIGEYFPYTPAEWLSYVLEPLRETGIDLETLKNGAVRAPYIPEVAWQDKKFLTPSGKAELISKEEFLSSAESPVEQHFEKMALARLAREIIKGNPREPQDELMAKKENKVLDFVNYKSVKNKKTGLTAENQYILMTPHPDMAMHSQFQIDEGFTAFLHPDTATRHVILQGDKIIVETETGQLVAVAVISEDVHEHLIVIPEGTTDNQLGVNRLIQGKMSSFGESTAYYDAFCQIRRWEQD